MAALTITSTVDRPHLIQAMREAFADPRDLMTVLGVAQLGGMATRLLETYDQGDEAYRTGNMLRSLQVYAPGTGPAGSIFEVGAGEMTVGSSVPYANIQDQGGTITPKTVRYLAVPLTRDVKVRGMWPRDFARGDLYFRAKVGGGQTVGFLFDAREGALGLGRGPLFALVSSVTLPAKGLTDAALRATADELDDIYHEWIEGIDDGK
jgi:hypothetical protein